MPYGYIIYRYWIWRLIIWLWSTGICILGEVYFEQNGCSQCLHTNKWTYFDEVRVWQLECPIYLLYPPYLMLLISQFNIFAQRAWALTIRLFSMLSSMIALNGDILELLMLFMLLPFIDKYLSLKHPIEHNASTDSLWLIVRCSSFR